MESDALNRLENRWSRFTERVSDRLKETVPESVYKDVSGWAERQIGGPESAPESLPERFRQWWENFGVGFRRAESGVFPSDTPEPPEVPSDLWTEAVQDAESGDVKAVAILTFAQVRREWDG
jgi:hypothetical protein